MVESGTTMKDDYRLSLAALAIVERSAIHRHIAFARRRFDRQVFWVHDTRTINHLLILAYCTTTKSQQESV
jgi:hypothetical protein